MKQGIKIVVLLILKSKEKKYLLVECRLVKSTCRISKSFECLEDFRILSPINEASGFHSNINILLAFKLIITTQTKKHLNHH
ncbi:hypothetical protein SADUNF_Sadunf16G0204200 [Salix dunnii]|uniref:Uncharacterized protein n=1 Tax=Salix dunnii TaxID=1413687 RepID=A0A835J9K1_9ROSI|nr:hypothetical protein SADUNF_Sadunf16G0204200 [Salix dunnii]